MRHISEDDARHLAAVTGQSVESVNQAAESLYRYFTRDRERERFDTLIAALIWPDCERSWLRALWAWVRNEP
jgi:hypothetical protein